MNLAEFTQRLSNNNRRDLRRILATGPEEQQELRHHHCRSTPGRIRWSSILILELEFGKARQVIVGLRNEKVKIFCQNSRLPVRTNYPHLSGFIRVPIATQNKGVTDNCQCVNANA